MKRQLVEELQELFDLQSKLTPKQKIRKEQFVLSFPLFELIYQKKGQANLQTILSSLRLVRVDFGEIIFKGQEGRSFNFILQGVVMLFVKGKQNKDQPRLFRRLQKGQYFGQKIVFSKEQLDSVRAASPGYMLQLPMPIFYATFSGHFKYEQLKEPIKFLQGIWVFSEVKRALLQRILLSSETRRCSRNSILAKQGDQVEHLFVIMEGEVTLYFTRHGRSNPLCVLGKGEVCGIEELVNQKPYCHTFICTSDHAQILKVEKETALDIVERDIPEQIMRKRSRVATQLRQKNLDPNSLKICSQKQLQILFPKKAETHRRRYRSEGGKPQPQITVKPLNQLFDRQVQLKESQLRRYRLQQIQETQKALYSTNRISTYANNSCTYDKEIIARYLDRKQRRFRDIIRKERQMTEKKVLLVPQLRVQRSSAVRNHKRKLKNSRQNLYSTLEIYD